MQHCQYCGQELLEGARFCGNCGRVPVSASQPGFSMAQGGSQAGNTPAGPPPFPSAYAGSSQAFSQQPQARGQFSQPGPQAFAQGPQNSQFQQPQFQPQNPVPGQGPAPAQFQPSSPQQFQQPGMPGIPPQFPQQQPTPSKGSSGGIPRWLLIALVAIVVIAIGGGAFALLHHSSPGTGGSPSTQSGSVTSSNPTPRLTPVSSQPGSVTSSNPTPGSTPVSSCIANPSRSANLTFSGSVSGDMVINSFTGCGPITSQGQNGYMGNASGTIGGTNYSFLFVALAYNGPGTYTFPKVAATLNKAGSSQKAWAIDPTASSTITINSDGRSGTLNLHLFDPANITSKVSVTGNWSGQ